MRNKLTVAFLTTDNREQQSKYDLEAPFFGPAPAAILESLKLYPEELDIHVISCSKRRMNAPEKIAHNVWFHQPIVPHIGWGRTAFLGCTLAVRKLLRKIKPNLVHGQGTERDCAISAVYSGYPNVLTIHGNMQQICRLNLLGARGYYRLASKLETHALKRTNGVFCNSKHTQSLVEHRTKKTWLVPNPLRCNFFNPPPENRIKNTKPIILTIGAISPLKRSLEILQMAKKLAKRGYYFQIRFIGWLPPEGRYRSSFEAAIDEGRGAGYADFIGTLGIDNLIQELDQADACVHFPHEEAFGLVVAESMARNLTFFGASVGGIQDIANEVDGALLFSDFLSLENGMAAWLESGAQRAQGASSIMASRYHPKVIGHQHIEIYRKVLSLP
jgi:glycosyltransferase involved in cell wall biosynthesis